MSNRPTQTATGAHPNPHAVRNRVRRELVIASSCLGVGLLVLPALIYGVGTLILGPYSGGPHLGSFYGDYFRNLIALTARTWWLVFSPLILVSLLRLVFLRWPGKTPPKPHGGRPNPPGRQVAQTEKQAEGEHIRREPFIAP